MNDATQSTCVSLTRRDREMLTALSRCVRVFSERQVRSRWWPNGGAPAPRLRRLEQAGLLIRYSAFAEPPSSAPEPLLCWSPGDETPAWDEVIAVSRQRWNTDLASRPVVSITRAGAAQFGGVSRFPKPSEAAHDLMVAQVYLHLCKAHPQQCKAWVGETLIRHQRDEPVPDALLRLPGRRVAVEVVGRGYRPKRLATLIDYCRQQDWSCQLW